MASYSSLLECMLGIVLVLSSLGVILAPKPVHASLSFLLSLLTLAALYLQLSAHFIAAMLILVYAGAILVLFVFVIVLFQDAHAQLFKFSPKSSLALLAAAGTGFIISLVHLGWLLVAHPYGLGPISDDFGTVQALGKALYLDFFFPFEAVILLFLVAIVGALYTAKKEEQ